MSYDPTQPAAGTSPASTRATIQGNFNQANIAIGRDHIPFDAATNEGLHQKVTLVTVQPGGGPSISGTQSALYMKTVGATQQLFFKNSSGEKQLTAATVPQPQWPVIAFGRFNIASGTLAPSLVANSHFNVASVTLVAGQRWTVTLSSGNPTQCTIIATAVLGNGNGRGTLVTNVTGSSFGLTYTDGSGVFRGSEISGFSFMVLRN